MRFTQLENKNSKKIKNHVFLLVLTIALMSVAQFSFAEIDKGLSPTAIAKEYNDVRKKRISGYFGDAGAEVIKAYEKRIANYLSIKLNAKDCRDLQKYIPLLDTGYYVFAIDDPERSVKELSSNNGLPRFFVNGFNSGLTRLLPILDKKTAAPPKLVTKRCISYGALLTIITM